jgi:hypothetical protein
MSRSSLRHRTTSPASGLRQRVPDLLATVMLLAFCAQSHAQTFADVQVELLSHDNLTRSERDSDAREDTALLLAGTAGIHLQPGDYTGLTLTGALNRTQYRRYTGLSSWEAGLGLDLSHKFGIGDRQPALSVELGIARNEYNRSLRDAWIYRAGLALQKRLTATLNLGGGLRYEKRDADHNVPRVIPVRPRPGNSWDVSARSFFVTAEQDLGATLWLSAGYTFQDGDVVSTAVSYPKIFNAATAITLDPLFGPATVAYRIPARTHILALDLNRAVFEAGTLYLGLEYQDTHGDSDIDYTSSVLRAGFIHSF